MLIAMNAGNSHIALAGYEGDTQVFVASIATDPSQTGDFYACALQQIFSLHRVDVAHVKGAVISAVVPQMIGVLTHALHLLGVTDLLCLASGVKTGLDIRSEQPRQVGTDRVAAAVAARARGQLPCVVVSLATATTFTVLDARGALIASAITAGVLLSVAALRQTAAQLPAVAIEQGCDTILARSTEQAMRVGALYGAACMVDGMVARYAQALGQTPCVLLTGGGATQISPLLHIEHTVVPHLILEGLHQIWKKNRP